MRLWIFVLFTVALGAGIGFLSLETAGLIWLPMALAGLVLWRRQSPALGTSLIACGLGSVAAVTFFAVRTSGLIRSSEDPGTLAYFASQLAIGIATIVAGIVLYHRKDWVYPKADTP